jgi:histidine ammonia-lyase
MFKYGEDQLTIESALKLEERSLRGVLSDTTIHKINQSSGYVDQIVNNKKVVYGINTGFGPLCDTRISQEQTELLQHNLLKSHAVGVGSPIPKNIARLMLITKVHALARGYSGIRLSTLERILWHLDNDIIPVVPEKGSVGASGDLAPLAHLFLPLIGLGSVQYRDQIVAMSHVCEIEGVQPLTLGPKEGLALINGTQFILAHAVEVVSRWKKLLDIADITGCLSLEALMGSAAPFDVRLHELRPFHGNQLVANRLRNLLEGSQILVSHAECDRIQDPYSLRCMPQVHGASRNAWLHLKELTEIELNSVTDNPIIFDETDTISGGNFHGQSLALPLDYAAFAVSELGNISDRRSYMMLEGRYGLPKLLINDPGFNSGFMIPQYTAAALVTENKTLCFPASADSIPTSLGQEDHVSMGSISGRKTLQILENLEYIFAIELLYASQALEFRRPLKSSPILEEIHSLIRTIIPFADEDRVFSDDINKLKELISSNKINYLVDNHINLYDGFESFNIR